MQQLPKGYYAVVSDYQNAPKDTFTYRGETYAVKDGENLFPTVNAACAAATETPDVVLGDLPYDSFEAPVILFSVGEHKMDKFVIDRSIVLLGEKAGVNPNLPTEKREDMPALNPLREGAGETLVKGGYWTGKPAVPVGTNAATIIFDGFTTRDISFRDLRNGNEGEAFVAIRNIVQYQKCAYVLYLFNNAKTAATLSRRVEITNLRVVDFDDYDYGTFAVMLNAASAVLDGVCYVNAAPSFGFSDSSYGKCQIPANSNACDIVVKNSYFANLSPMRTMGTSARSARADQTMRFTVENTTFVDAGKQNEPVLKVYLHNDQSTFRADNCLFVDTRGNSGAAVEILGTGEDAQFSDCAMRGFVETVARHPMLSTDVPEKIENHSENWETKTEDPHTVLGIENADFSAADALYADRHPYYGDLHVHTACGGTSDGSTPMAEWIPKMDAKQLDFVAIVDHRQMRGFFLPEWDEDRFLMGTEPGTFIEGLNAMRLNMGEVHYNMLFPHKYGLAMVLANYPEFQFHGDELTGSFGYPHFTKERFAELAAFVRSLGGIFVHPHPKTMMVSDDPLDYYIGEHTFMETIYASPDSSATLKNYEIWTKILAAGKKVYSSCGSDTHGGVTNSAVATFYTTARKGDLLFQQMRSADFTCGNVGFQMCIDGNPMGSEVPYREGMELTLRVDDFFAPTTKSNAIFELRILSDRGVAYVSRFKGTAPQAVALSVQKRAFYRAEIYDLYNEQFVAIGNPIWLE